MKHIEKVETYSYKIPDRLGRAQTVQIIFVDGKYRAYSYHISDDIEKDIENLKIISKEIKKIEEEER